VSEFSGVYSDVDIKVKSDREEGRVEGGLRIIYYKPKRPKMPGSYHIGY